MNENEFEHDGQRYRAVDCDDDGPCYKCALLNIPCADLQPCAAHLRKDGRAVIFVEVKP